MDRGAWQATVPWHHKTARHDLATKLFADTGTDLTGSVIPTLGVSTQSRVMHSGDLTYKAETPGHHHLKVSTAQSAISS